MTSWLKPDVDRLPPGGLVGRALRGELLADDDPSLEDESVGESRALISISASSRASQTPAGNTSTRTQNLWDMG